MQPCLDAAMRAVEPKCGLRPRLVPISRRPGSKRHGSPGCVTAAAKLRSARGERPRPALWGCSWLNSPQMELMGVASR